MVVMEDSEFELQEKADITPTQVIFQEDWGKIAFSKLITKF